MLSSNLNRALSQHPALRRCLSPLGLRAAFSKGVPFQCQEAARVELNATAGQITDGHGQAAPLKSLKDQCSALDSNQAFLYSPLEGHTALTEAWAARQPGRKDHRTCRPILVHGLTQGLSITADLFADEDTDIILPDLHWENYRAIFCLRSCARVRTYPFYSGDRFNVSGLAHAVSSAKRKAIVVLNFPHNPTGYMPDADEIAAIVDALNGAAAPTIVVCDDAYQGLVYDPQACADSLFWTLLEKHDPNVVFPIKIDGATKELSFFGGRIGFITLPPLGKAEEALRAKIKGLICASTISSSGPSQAILLRALESETLDDERAEQLSMLTRRFLALQRALLKVDNPMLEPLKGGAGIFVLLRVDRRICVEQLRQHLLRQYSVGVIVQPASNTLRIAFSSVCERDMPRLIDAIDRAINDLSQPVFRKAS